MFQKISIITAILCIFLISFLFVFLFISVDRELFGEQKRMERYIDTTASQAIIVFRNEILYLYEHYSTEIRNWEKTGWNGEKDFLEEFHQLVDFPSLIEDVFIIKSKGADGLIRIRGENVYLPVNELSGHGQSLIHISNFLGYMIFPLRQEKDSDSSEFLVVSLNIRPAIESYLINRLLEELLKSPFPVMEDDLSDYVFIIKEGFEIKKENREVDLVIDLNRSFNLTGVRDYYYIRPGSFQSVSDSRSITDNHLYLTISHRAGTLPIYFSKKRFWIYGGIGLLYLFLVAALLLFLYSTYRTKSYYQKEQHFTSLISHELKTPLSVIQLAAENLSGGFLEEMDGVAEYGKIIRDETSRLNRMIENILLLSTRTWEEEGIEKLSINEIIKELRMKNHYLLNRHRVSLEINNYHDKSAFQISGTLLIAALQNLIHNGIIYGADFSEDRKVILNIEKLKKGRVQGILFSIIDHGPGMGWAESQKIFDRFYRGSDATEQQLPGSGMGLAISRRITNELGGSLQLKRSMRRETVFELWIPNRMVHEKNTNDRR